MKYRFLVLALLAGALLGITRAVRAESSETAEPYTGAALCLPDA